MDTTLVEHRRNLAAAPPVNPQEQGKGVKSAVLILACPLHGDQQAVRAVRRGLVRAHGGLGLVVEELPECRVLPAADAPTELTGEPCGFS
jgi:hypothetical protein